MGLVCIVEPMVTNFQLVLRLRPFVLSHFGFVRSEASKRIASPGAGPIYVQKCSV